MKGKTMALTSGGSVNPTPSAANGAAQRVSYPGVTRAERLGNESGVAAAATPNSVGENSYGDAFIDGGSLPRLDSDNRPDVRQAAQINGGDSGFPGLANEGYSDIPGNPNGVEQSNAGSANIVHRQARVSGGGQSSGEVAADTSEAYGHGSSAGFPFQVPSARQV